MSKFILSVLVVCTIIPAAFAGEDVSSAQAAAKRYQEQYAKGQITKAEYDDLMGGLKDLQEMKRLGKKRASDVKSSPIDYAARAAKYKAELDGGKITQDEYNFLLGGLKDLQEMQRISRQKPSDVKSVPVDYAARAAKYKAELDGGKITPDEYNFLLGGLKDLQEMQRLANEKRITGDVQPAFDYDARARKYTEQLNSGELTRPDYDDLMQALSALRRMNNPQYAKPARSASNTKLDVSSMAKRYTALHAQGKLSDADYNYMMQSLKDLNAK